jgi:heterodisulfide reductase subunit C
VNTVDAIKKLRYLAVKNGYPHPELHKVAIENLYTTGNGVPLSDEAARYRSMLSDKSIGFERLPFDLSTNEEELKKFRSLIDELGMMSIVK